MRRVVTNPASSSEASPATSAPPPASSTPEHARWTAVEPTGSVAKPAPHGPRWPSTVEATVERPATSWRPHRSCTDQHRLDWLEGKQFTDDRKLKMKFTAQINISWFGWNRHSIYTDDVKLYI